MNQSEQVNELFAALAKAQSEIENAVKNKINPHFKNSYADLGAVLDAAREALSKQDLCVLQQVTVDAEKTYLVTILGHKSGQWIKSTAPLIADKPTSQSLGSALTYMRRYALAALVGIAQEDDDGNKASEPGNAKKVEPEKPKAAEEPKPITVISKEQCDVLNAIFDECPLGYKEEVLKSMKITLDKLPAIIFDKFKAKILEERAKNMMKVPV